jgi:hypothetical protein
LDSNTTTGDPDDISSDSTILVVIGVMLWSGSTVESVPLVYSTTDLSCLTHIELGLSKVVRFAPASAKMMQRDLSLLKVERE